MLFPLVQPFRQQRLQVASFSRFLAAFFLANLNIQILFCYTPNTAAINTAIIGKKINLLRKTNVYVLQYRKFRKFQQKQPAFVVFEIPVRNS